jgi:hypothetical protein
LREPHKDTNNENVLVLYRYEAVLNINPYVFSSKDSVIEQNFIASLFFQTMKPYLQLIDQWIIEGKLFDPYNEFMIERFETTIFCNNLDILT